MKLICDTSIAAKYRSAAQRARIISEHWFATNAYCLACQSEILKKTTPNTVATDFLCASCGHAYELKTFRRRPKTSIPDGAYGTFLARIRAGTTPTLCLLERSTDWAILSLTAIHASLITEWAVESRPPLAPVARRAGWIGCNIRLDRIPPDAEIALIRNGVEQSKEQARRNFQVFLPLSNLSSEKRGWTTLTLNVLNKLRHREFTLGEIYAHQDEFAHAYPNNQHIREKIRQQLQILRNLGRVEFRGKGVYLLKDPSRRREDQES